MQHNTFYITHTHTHRERERERERMRYTKSPSMQPRSFYVSGSPSIAVANIKSATATIEMRLVVSERQ